ncbi:hypothetical protein [Synechococcus sp. A15-127]|uniref:hypothetical protein n=1 Tax=Synechococcus sp. A15-127 TaxID=1050624 RepID=UPI0016482763|nr:hypothetical protein [Synechococcus sp. A15-127]
MTTSGLRQGRTTDAPAAEARTICHRFSNTVLSKKMRLINKATTNIRRAVAFVAPIASTACLIKLGRDS